VAQGEGPEFKPQYSTKKKKERKEKFESHPGAEVTIPQEAMIR
jgi:hypothetical protein